MRLRWASRPFWCEECGARFRSRELSPQCYDCGAPAIRDAAPEPPRKQHEPPPLADPGTECLVLDGRCCGVCGTRGTARQHLIFVAPGLPDGGRRFCRPCLAKRDAALSQPVTAP